MPHIPFELEKKLRSLLDEINFGDVMDGICFLLSDTRIPKINIEHLKANLKKAFEESYRNGKSEYYIMCFFDIMCEPGDGIDEAGFLDEYFTEISGFYGICKDGFMYLELSNEIRPAIWKEYNKRRKTLNRRLNLQENRRYIQCIKQITEDIIRLMFVAIIDDGPVNYVPITDQPQKIDLNN